MSADPLPPHNPFPGLRPFRSDEHHLFFGREDQTAALLQLLREQRFLAVVGTSGSGKSSLVRAGMIAELYGGTMTQAGSTWEVMILRPGGSPLENLAKAMVEADLYDAQDASTLPRLLATLSRSRFGLVEAVKQSGVFESNTNLLVVVDQFEELFRFRQQGVDSEEAATSFVNLLLTAAAQAERPIYVTITMRSDYLGDCSEIPGLAEAVNEGEYLIPRLLRDQKRDAIEKPIGVGGAKISPLLVQRLLNDVGDDPDQLPVLQHALMRMWDKWSAGSDHNRPIEFSDFEATGGLAAALSNHADEIYDALPDDTHRQTCERIFKTLTVKGEDNRGIRRPTRLSQVQAIAGANRAVTTAVLDAFRKSGVTFVMPGTEVELGDRTVLDLSHESLMRGWQRLRAWVEDESQSARIFRRLSDTASLWRDRKAGLFRDPDLQIALSWREQQQPSSDWAELYGGQFDAAIGFLDSSSAEAEAEHQAQDAARRRELEQAQRLAEAQQLQLEQQQRSAGNLRKMIVGLAIVAIVAVLACVAALVSNKRANNLAVVAKQKSEIAQASAEDADRERKMAVQAKKATETALSQVESQKSAVESSLAKAKQAEQVARSADEAGRKLLYTTDMRLFPFVWGDDRTPAQKLRGLLEKHIPDSQGAKSNSEPLADKRPDLRGFEWHYYQHLLDGSAAAFSGHEASVVSAALTPDGQLVTLDLNGQMRRWNLDSQAEELGSRRDLLKGGSAADRILSPDGRLAALAKEDKVHVFDTSTGKEAFQIDSPDGPARQLIFTPSSDRLVIVDNKIRWCAAAGGQVIGSLNQEFNRGLSLALSADGLTLAVVGHGTLGNQFSIFQLDPATQKVTPLAKDAGSTGTLSSAALSPDGRLIVVGRKLSGTAAVYDTATGRPLAEHGSAHASPVSAMAFSGDGYRLVTGDVEGTIKIWEDVQRLTSKSAAATTFKVHEGAITQIGFSSTGSQLVSTSADKTARVWDLRFTGTAMRVLERSGNSCYSARFSADGQLIAAADGNSVRLWDAATGSLARELSAGEKGRVYSVAFSPTDSRLLAVGYGGQVDISHVVLWDIDAGTELARLTGATDMPGLEPDDEYSGAVGALAFSPDGKYLVAGFGSPNLISPASTPNPLKVWEVASRRLIRRLNGHNGFCLSLDFSRDGSHLASGSRDGTAIIWSTKTWKATQILLNSDPDASLGQLARGMVDDVAFSPDGSSLAMASREGSIHLWDVATGKLLDTLKGHSSAVNAVVFSSDGRTLASGGSDRTVRLWNVESRRELVQLDSGNIEMAGVESLVFSPDGKHLLAGRSGGAAFWSTAPMEWSDPDQAAEVLRRLRKSNADFQSRIQMMSDNLGLHAALERFGSKDPEVLAALAATRANWHAAHGHWAAAVKEYDRLQENSPGELQSWLRTPGLLRIATALFHEGRPSVAAGLLTGGAKRRSHDGLPPVAETVGFGFMQENQSGAYKIIGLVPGSPAARSTLRAGDVLIKVNDVALSNATGIQISDQLQGEAGTKVRLTVRHLASGQTEDVELVKEKYLPDLVTGELWRPLLAEIEARLVKEPDNAGLLELRAELAGQWSGWEEQATNYTAAIEVVKQQQPVPEADLHRLYRRRGDAYLALKKWQQADDDYGQGITGEINDEALLANQAMAQAEVLLEGVDSAETKIANPWVRLAAAYRLRNVQASIDALVKRRPQVAAAIGELFAADKQWERAIEIYNMVITERTTDIDLLSKRALAYEGLQSWDAAAADWNRAAGANPAGALLHAGFARRLAKSGQVPLAQTQRQASQKIYEQALQADPGNTIVAEQLADLLLDGTPADQTRFALASGEQDPWLRLAVGYAVNGQSETASRHFAAALDAAGTLDAERPIVQESSRFDSVLAALFEQRRNNPLLRLAMASNHAKHGLKNLDGQHPAEAQRELEKSRDLFTRFLADYPNTEWVAAKPKEMKSEGGATFTLQEDGSILAGGPNPDQDTYTIRLQPGLSKVIAIRLETLPDDTLLNRGSGRSGNFNLTGITLYRESKMPDRRREEIKIKAAWVDHSDRDSGGAKDGAEGIIDSSDQTHWSVSPRQYEPHVAVLQLENAVDLSQEAALTVQLHFQHKANLRHAIGRFRLSLSDEVNALTTASLKTQLVNSELASVYAALGIAQAQQGDGEGAVASLTQAFQLSDERQPQLRYMAARAAALASAGKGQNGSKSLLDDAAKARLRVQAHDWLQAELTNWSKLLASAAPQERLAPVRLNTLQALSRWQHDRDLAGIRDAETLAKLPPEEQKAFTQLWADAATLIAKADGGFRTLPPLEQVEEVRKELKKRNPGYDGTLTPTIQKDVVTGLKFNTDHVTDISPICALIHLRSLDMHGTYVRKGILSDLSPLVGMSLNKLDCSSTQVTDLNPLRGMPLTSLYLSHSAASDLAPLQGMALVDLGIGGTRVSDLSPLRGMKLTDLMATGLPVKDISPLQGMPLTSLDLAYTRGVTNLTPLQGMPLSYVNLSNLPVSDISVLRGMTSLRNVALQDMPLSDLTPLQGQSFTNLALKSSQVTDADLVHLRECKSLKGITLQNTKVTAAGIEELKKIFPKCKIEWDGGVIEPK